MIPTLTPTQRQVFSAVYARPAQSLSDVERATGLTAGTVSRTAYALERHGLLVSGMVERRVGVRNRHPRMCRVMMVAPWVML